MAKRTTRPNPISVYLGTKDERERRMVRIREAAEKYAGTTDDGKPAVSKLLQMIGDGDLEVTPRKSA